jgi:hypothetical protein
VQAAEYRGTVVELTQAQHNVLAASAFIEKAVHGELRKRRWQLGSGDKNDRHRCAPDLKVLKIRRAGIVTAGSERRLG